MTMTAEKAVASAAVEKSDNDVAKAGPDGGDLNRNAGSSVENKAIVEQAVAEKASVDKAGADKAGMDKAASGSATTGENRPVLAHDKRKALGRGLESLLGGPRVAPSAPVATAAAVAATPASAEAPVPGVIADLQAVARKKPDDHEVIDLAIDRIGGNPHQTRSFTKEEVDSLQELSDSIKAQGVIQPVTVRPGKDGRYILITGERRMRASTMAGKTTIPAIVRVVSEQQAAEMTVIENLQRRDLNCIDLARAYIMLSQDFGLTQEQIGSRVGVSRETVSNYMRLAKLPEVVQVYLQNGALEFSHARILLNLGDTALMVKVARKAVNDEMSVDQLEHYVVIEQGIFLGEKPPAAQRGARWVDPNVRAAQRRLEEILGVRVKIRDHKGKGKITLEYATLEDFDRVLGMLTGGK
jgi:ParB family chromosome partitioning protein